MTAMDYASAAKELSGKGRNGDSMLVHMTPEEVGGLQNLAMAAGGSLSLNPETGLVEANFLKKLLPTLLGVGLSAAIPGLGPLAAAGLVGGGQTLLTGDINKGLMAGLQAFGGASLAGGLGIGATAKALPAITNAPLAGTVVPGIKVAGMGSLPGFSLDPLSVASTGAAPSALGTATAKTGLAGFGQKFGAAASTGLGGMMAKGAPYAAGFGLLSGLSDAGTSPQQFPEQPKSIYEGPYRPQERIFRPRSAGSDGTGEMQFFEDANPYPGYLTRTGSLPSGYAEGGLAALPAAGDLQGSMDFFRGNSPGPITASKTYPEGTSIQDVKRKISERNDMVDNAMATNEGNSTVFEYMRKGYLTPDERSTLQNNYNMSTPEGQKVIQDTMNRFGSNAIQFGQPNAPSMAPPTPANPATPASPAREVDFNFKSLNGPPPASPAPMSIDDVIRGYRGESYARGGEVNMKDGSFVVDARTVSELGNGSSNAGIERLAGMGGRPVRGDGDGVSDSVPARIGGRQEARVARDEVIFSPEAVARLGGGNHSKGTKKLYAMMDKAHTARKRAKRGQDTKVAKGLGALA